LSMVNIKKKNKDASLSSFQRPFSIIMWTILSGDFDQKVSPERCFQNVILNAKRGNIIVFHDSTKAWNRMSFALPKVLEHFSNEGFSFKTL